MLGLPAGLDRGARLVDQPLRGRDLVARGVSERQQRHRVDPAHVHVPRRDRVEVVAQPRLGLAGHARPEQADREEVGVARHLRRIGRAQRHRGAGHADRFADVTLPQPEHRARARDAGRQLRALVLVGGRARRLVDALEPRLDLLERPAHRARHAATCERQVGVLVDRGGREAVDPADRVVGLAVAVEREPAPPQRVGSRAPVAGADRVLDRPAHVAAVGEPRARPLVQLRHGFWRVAVELAQQHRAEQRVVAEPAPVGVERDRRTGCCSPARAACRRCRGARARRRTARSTAARAQRCASGSRASGAAAARRPRPTGSRRGSGRRPAGRPGRRRDRRSSRSDSATRFSPATQPSVRWYSALSSSGASRRPCAPFSSSATSASLNRSVPAPHSLSSPRARRRPRRSGGTRCAEITMWTSWPSRSSRYCTPAWISSAAITW